MLCEHIFRADFVCRLTGVAPSLTNNSLQSVAGQKQSTKMEAGSGIISSLISEKSVTSRWEVSQCTSCRPATHYVISFHRCLKLVSILVILVV